jgi:hypothetical protein
MLMKIVELLVAAVLGGLLTMAASWLMVGGRIRVLAAGYKRLDHEFEKCHDEHLDCPDQIKEACQTSIKELAEVVDALTKTTSLISSTLDAHLRVSQQLDESTEKRFARIESQLNRIEMKLDQLKGWHAVEN